MDWRYNTIWFEQLADGKLYHLDSKKDNLNVNDFQNSEYSIIWHLKKKEGPFDNFPASKGLKYLELNWANIIGLEGINKFPNLKRLELHHCIKLESVSDLTELKGTLKFLHINQSKKLSIDEAICELKNLKVLCLNACGPIDNLDFLNDLPDLLDFRFVNTKVLSGDLNPILEHPNLRSVGFLNKRHYNLKAEKVKEVLREKFSDKYKVEVSKGEFATYRYTAFG